MGRCIVVKEPLIVDSGSLGKLRMMFFLLRYESRNKETEADQRQGAMNAHAAS